MHFGLVAGRPQSKPGSGASGPAPNAFSALDGIVERSAPPTTPKCIFQSLLNALALNNYLQSLPNCKVYVRRRLPKWLCHFGPRS